MTDTPKTPDPKTPELPEPDEIIEFITEINWTAVLAAFVIGGAVTAAMLWLFFSQPVAEDIGDVIDESAGE